VQDGAHGSYRSLDPVLPGLDPIHKVQRSHETDCPVTAHAEISNVIKEDDAGGAGRIDRVAQQCSYHNVGAARLIHDSRSEIVVLAAKAFQPFGQRPGAEIGAPADNHPRRLASRVGVDHSNSSALAVGHFSAREISILNDFSHEGIRRVRESLAR
jgi:hypothetical protein